MPDIIDTPRTLTLNDVVFTVDEVDQLKAAYPTMDFQVFEKEAVRTESFLQKALLSGAVASLAIESGEQVTLNLTQDGRALLGKV